MAKNKCRTPEIQKYSNEVRTSYDSLYNQIQSDPHKALQTVQNMELKVNTAIVSLKYIDAVLTSLYDATGDQQLKPIIDQVENDINMANKVNALLVELEADIKDGNNPTGKLNQLKTFIDQIDNGINTR